MLNLLAFIFFSTFSSNINNYLKREMALKFCTTVFSLVCKHFPIEKTKILVLTLQAVMTHYVYLP